jgi:hypothetical protein
VTIAAGFRFENAILLCADTQYTSSTKTHETKIFPIKHGAATVILALTGRQIFAKRAIERIKEGIEAIPENELSKGKLQDAIEVALRYIYNNHVYTHPDWGTDDAPDFDFVIGLYSPIDGDFLMATDETLTAEMLDHVCLGSGAYLGDYLSQMYKGRSQEMQEVVSLAIYILQQAKSYDQDCGGSSEFIVLWDDGDTSSIEEFDIAQKERFGEKFPRAIAPLFYVFSDLEKTDDEIQPKIDDAIMFMKEQFHDVRFAQLMKEAREFLDKLKVRRRLPRQNI